MSYYGVYTLRWLPWNGTFLLWIAATSSQNKSAVKTFPISFCFLSSEAFGTCRTSADETPHYAEPALTVMGLIYTQEDLEPSELHAWRLANMLPTHKNQTLEYIVLCNFPPPPQPLLASHLFHSPVIQSASLKRDHTSHTLTRRVLWL